MIRRSGTTKQTTRTAVWLSQKLSPLPPPPVSATLVPAKSVVTPRATSALAWLAAPAGGGGGGVDISRKSRRAALHHLPAT